MESKKICSLMIISKFLYCVFLSLPRSDRTPHKFSFISHFIVWMYFIMNSMQYFFFSLCVCIFNGGLLFGGWIVLSCARIFKQISGFIYIKYGAYYVTYIFRFISNTLWNWGGGEGGFHLIALQLGGRGKGRRGWLSYLIAQGGD